MFLGMKGFYRYNKCKVCKTTVRRKERRLELNSFTDNKNYDIKNLITCDSSHVIYVLECPCQMQYVDRTTRQLKVRSCEHIKKIKKGVETHSVSRHFKLKHNKDPSLVTVNGIERIEGHWRGMDRLNEVSRRETHWIYLMNTLYPNRLNIDIDLNCFLTYF